MPMLSGHHPGMASLSPHASRALRDLAANLQRLMEADKDYTSARKVAERAAMFKKIHPKTVTRILSLAGNEPTLDTVESIAKVFGLQAWQMLVPNLQPSRPPELADQAVTN